MGGASRGKGHQHRVGGRDTFNPWHKTKQWSQDAGPTRNTGPVDFPQSDLAATKKHQSGCFLLYVGRKGDLSDRPNEGSNLQAIRSAGLTRHDPKGRLALPADPSQASRTSGESTRRTLLGFHYRRSPQHRRPLDSGASSDDGARHALATAGKKE